MVRGTLNLGVLAHVDAGKTTLTERLLYAAGVIDEVGSVDDGTTQTDSLALERQRGITIRSAVVSFTVGDVTVNLIDTPGHPDFIAEVERALSVLDGAVLVISAVEGVQPQTRILMRALRRLRVPAVLFVNKIDRRGADERRVLREISERLDSADPVFFGSALTGAGIEALMAGITDLLPGAERNAEGPASGRVFKIERGRAGEKVAYVRMFSGTVRVRDRLDGRKVTAISVFEDGSDVRRGSVSAGQIAKIWGLADVQVGDAVGTPLGGSPVSQFAPPSLETVVIPGDPRQRGALHAALAQLAEQDPLINVRQDDVRQEISVSLFGEVQKEVIAATLAADFGLSVRFRETTTVCVERLAGVGAAVERLGEAPNPFLATIGLRVSPAAAGSGVRFGLEVEPGSMPLAFFRAVEDTARETLRQGLHGWAVPDCAVAMTHSGYVGKHSLGHQRFNKSMSSTGEDYRKLTPLVLTSALRQAGTVVCEPVHRFRLDAPADSLGPLLASLARLHAVPLAQVVRGALLTLEGEVPAAKVHRLRAELPALTRGEGVLECAFDRYSPVRGAVPTRPRTDDDPLNRVEYLQRVSGLLKGTGLKARLPAG